MPLCNVGRDLFASLLTGYTSVHFDNTNARIGVGDSSTAFAVTQTDLQAATNKVRVGMEATFPTTTANVLVFKSIFTSAVGNFTWAEWGIFNAASGATSMLCRLVEANGAKVAGQSWTFTATITVAVGA